MRMKKIIRALMIVAGLLVLSYSAFWLYVRHGGAEIEPVTPEAWILPDPGTDFRARIPLSGAGNFRTLGGLRIDSLSHVRPGKLFRSDSPSKYTAGDWEKLESMGVGMIIDLRSDKETEDDDYQVPENIRYIHNPVYRQDPMRDAFRILLYERHNLSRMMEEGYMNFVKGKAETFGQAINLISENPDKGIVFHCTAGKDRTGVLAALILSVLGVDRETIVYDYALSNHGFESNFNAFLEKGSSQLERFGVPPREMEVLFAVDPAWIICALDGIESEFGSVESYLLNEAGVSRENIEMLRKHLIVSGMNQF